MTAIEEYTVFEDRARSGSLHVFDQASSHIDVGPRVVE